MDIIYEIRKNFLIITESFLEIMFISFIFYIVNLLRKQQNEFNKLDIEKLDYAFNVSDISQLRQACFSA